MYHTVHRNFSRRGILLGQYQNFIYPGPKTSKISWNALSKAIKSHFLRPLTNVSGFVSGLYSVVGLAVSVVNGCRLPQTLWSDQSVLSISNNFTHFQREYLHQTLRIYYWYGLVDAHSFFGQKNFGVKGHDPKRGKMVKIYLLLQFLSQDVHIFRMCCPPQCQKITGNRFLIQGPKILQKIFKNGQNFELFYYLSQDLKNFRLDRFWGPYFVSVENFWFGAPVWPPTAVSGCPIQFDAQPAWHLASMLQHYSY